MSQGPFVCDFCQSSEEAEITGPLLKKDDVVAHHNCLLYSSNLVNRNTPDGDDLLGFDTEDVKEELRRGSRLTCFKCRRSGATVGCEVKKCQRSYHYRCAIETNAENVEDVRRGVFTIYCHSHRHHLGQGSSANSSTGEHLKHTRDVSGDSDSVKRKILRLSTGSYMKRQERESSCNIRRLQYDDDPATSDEGHHDIELEPLESDLDDTEDVSFASLNSAEHGNGRYLTDEPQPSTSGAFQSSPGESRRGAELMAASNPKLCKNERLAKMGRAAVSVKATEKPHSGNEETYIESELKSQSIPRPIKITNLELIALDHSEGNSGSGSGSSRSSSSAAYFWRKCREAECVESIFSTFTSAMTSISERILSEQASEQDCALSLKVLEASGMLPEIFAQKDLEFQEKLLCLQRESDAVKKSRSSMKTASGIDWHFLMGKATPNKTS